MINILLADDQQLMRDGISMLLELEEDMALVAEAANGREAIELYQQYSPDVVLMDIEMPTMDGIEAAKRIIELDANAKILVLTTFGQEDYVRRSLLAGARGFLLKAISGADLSSAIRKVQRGEAAVDAQSIGVLLQSYRDMAGTLQNPNSTLLNRREQEILELIAQHKSNREIAVMLSLAEGTIKNYISQLLEKLQVHDRKQAVQIGRDKGLL
ncbi:response regulator transcription factor [Gilvimarinus sp. SDUM040013]|uniref:Response regulator transcription factor n=1 Tax=Gilvimarinus gilvus TaxID=3058038 RepID=A0ABU4S4W1_9GAMM|nr:response regulator transcription factor [Gilvimarinus sp. SDUM040013]MDO3387170.1 response regulator transcription factor [Gilvimarinus sp. SDUM040013]MDX6850913.1 response regulator transcription factor [Gilvimarinus sp. SDUM040013]